MGKSSKDKRDAYYRLAKEQGWRARSAFKLLQLDEEFDLFNGVTCVVDLCAAPGSWSQVLSRVLVKGERFGRAEWEDRMARLRRQLREVDHEEAEMSGNKIEVEEDEVHGNANETKLTPRKDVRIVAIDLQPMSPLDGITMLKADITAPSTIPLLLHALSTPYTPSKTSLDASSLPPSARTTTNLTDPTPVQLVLSDGAPDVTGLHDLDIYVQAQLLRAALDLAARVLTPGTGRFVAKIFRGGDVDVLLAQLTLLFEHVRVAKPRASRASSLEAFVVCEGFFGGEIAEAAGFGTAGKDTSHVDQERYEKWEKTMAAAAGDLEALMNLVEEENVGDDTPLALRGKGPVQDEQGSRHGQRRRLRPDGITELELSSSDHTEDEDDAFPPSPRRWVPPFLACGDLSAWDSDATYHLPRDHVSLDPVQPPTAPPYKRALEMRRAAGGAYGKTKGKAPAND